MAIATSCNDRKLRKSLLEPPTYPIIFGKQNTNPAEAQRHFNVYRRSIRRRRRRIDVLYTLKQRHVFTGKDETHETLAMKLTVKCYRNQDKVVCNSLRSEKVKPLKMLPFNTP